MVNCENLICLIPHIITFILCASIIVVGIDCIVLLNKNKIFGQLNIFFYSIILTQILTILSFMFNQFGWIINNHGSELGLTVELGWLSYDYLNKLFHIGIIIFINTLIRTRLLHDCSLFGGKCPSDTKKESLIKEKQITRKGIVI